MRIFCAVVATFALAVMPRCAVTSPFVPLFDGKSLNGWTIESKSGQGYIVRDGLLICPSDGGGVLYTDRDYSDFILRFDFRLDKGGNNGVALRAPRHDRAPYDVLESQILDNSDPMYSGLLATQLHGALYKVTPVTDSALKPAGEWNREEIRAQGRNISVSVNGRKVVDADINAIRNPKVLLEHPGLLRDYGRIGFMGHGPAEVALRNIVIKDISRPRKDNTAPPGFKALFNGRNLAGWKGLVASPPERAKMTPEQLASKQKEADEVMRQHWSVVNGVLTYDGKGESLCTVKDYRNFEMLADWRIEPGGDSGIYLRGSPQVQIWDNPIGSGGLYNNQKNPSGPLAREDRPPGEWNRFRIVMIGERVTVFLNNELVVNGVVMENYWERDKPIYPTGQIELQNHNSKLEFKNIYIREIRD